MVKMVHPNSHPSTQILPNSSTLHDAVFGFKSQNFVAEVMNSFLEALNCPPHSFVRLLQSRLNTHALSALTRSMNKQENLILVYFQLQRLPKSCLKITYLETMYWASRQWISCNYQWQTCCLKSSRWRFMESSTCWLCKRKVSVICKWESKPAQKTSESAYRAPAGAPREQQLGFASV